ncbi:MAG TPA: AAA family ATPase [Candidatus Saccharimonadales bacterium]|nr:AAA family ATPase [Candidatus Saccharimonadales bacterium]
MATQQEIDAYVAQQMRISNIRTRNAITDRLTKERFPRRSAILKLEKLLRSFQAGQDPRWIALLGLRGVGKTTMISQLFQAIRCNPRNKIFVAIDNAKDSLEIGVSEIVQGYERYLGLNFEELTEPIYIFLDEIHFDPRWALSLKTLTDRSEYIFVVTTGSSVAEIKKALDSDTARRILAETLHPLSFTEYLLLRDGKKPIGGLGGKIRCALYESANVDEVYTRLAALREDVRGYWSGANQTDIDKYIKYANLPFTLTYGDNEQYIYQQIAQIITTIINKDIASLGNFDSATIRKINPILYTLANTSIASVNNMSSVHSIDRGVLTFVLEALEKASVVQRVYPYAQHEAQTTRPSKYLFVSPAYRSMFFNLVGSVVTYDDYKGFLLEDIVGLYLSILTRQGLSTMAGGLSITYDGADNGADFIVSSDGRRICVEVGYGNKKSKQANASKVRHRCVYGLTVSSSPLGKSTDSVTVPLSFFLLTA